MRFPIFSSDGSNLYTNAEYSSLQERKDGFQPNHAANSKLVNSFMKTASVLLDALAQYSSTSGNAGPEITSIAFGRIVDTDTAQTIDGVKTFIAQPKIRQLNVDQAIATENWVNARYLKKVGNFGDSDQLLRIELYYTLVYAMPFVINYGSPAVAYKCCWMSGVNAQLTGTTFLYFTSEKDLITYRIDYNAYKTQTFLETFGSLTNCTLVPFNSIPMGPNSDPTLNNQFTRKKYVDDEIAKHKLYRHVTVCNNNIQLETVTTSSTTATAMNPTPGVRVYGYCDSDTTASNPRGGIVSVNNRGGVSVVWYIDGATDTGLQSVTISNVISDTITEVTSS